MARMGERQSRRSGIGDPEPQPERRSRLAPVTWILLLVVAMDAVLVILHLFYLEGAGGLRGDLRTRLDKDRGFAEVFGAAQLCAAAVVLLIVARKRKVAVAAAWAFGLIAIVLDDLAAIHERVGTMLAPTFDSVFESNAQQVGELLGFGVLGLAVATPIYLTHRSTTSDLWTQRFSWTMAAAVGMLVLAGLVIDVVHGLVAEGSALAGLLTILEDGGELFAMSLVLAVAVTALVDKSMFDRFVPRSRRSP